MRHRVILAGAMLAAHVAGLGFRSASAQAATGPIRDERWPTGRSRRGTRYATLPHVDGFDQERIARAVRKREIRAERLRRIVAAGGMLGPVTP